MITITKTDLLNGTVKFVLTWRDEHTAAVYFRDTDTQDELDTKADAIGGIVGGIIRNQLWQETDE